MLKLWDFVAFYLVSSSRFPKCGISLKVCSDLKWWNQLLPVYNGVQFFDTQNRKTIQLYTDASLFSLDSLFYKNNANFWSDYTSSIPQSQAFSVLILSASHINIYKLEAIFLAIEAWGSE